MICKTRSCLLLCNIESSTPISIARSLACWFWVLFIIQITFNCWPPFSRWCLIFLNLIFKPSSFLSSLSIYIINWALMIWTNSWTSNIWATILSWMSFWIFIRVFLPLPYSNCRFWYIIRFSSHIDRRHVRAGHIFVWMSLSFFLRKLKLICWWKWACFLIIPSCVFLSLWSVKVIRHVVNVFVGFTKHASRLIDSFLYLLIKVTTINLPSTFVLNISPRKSMDFYCLILAYLITFGLCKISEAFSDSSCNKFILLTKQNIIWLLHNHWVIN